MVQKLKDTFSFVKAKIGGDQLDQKLVESVSQQNWQTSTHILHEIANAAYNYEKWQRISEFIWDKLKKNKSWRKILKTLNLIEFLLKNGPQSVITSFKYDIYQLRTFQNYSYYSDGNDRGESIRQRAKVVVGLLNNQQLLEEERVKAKTIRQKMSNVLGSGNNYGAGGYGGGSNNKNYDNYDKGNKYDNYDKKKTTTNKDNSYKYGNEGLGVYGDYSYNKSTLDKYKDKSSEPTPTTTTNNNNNHNQGFNKKQEEKKPEIVAQTKKPFQQSVSKLAKPGQKKANLPEPPKVQTSTNQNNNNTMINFLDDEPKPATTYQPPQQQTQQPTQQFVQPQSQPQPQQNNNFATDLNFFGTPTSNPVQNTPVNTSQQQNNPNLYNQAPNNNNQQATNQQFYPPQQPQQQPPQNFNKPVVAQQNFGLPQQQPVYPTNNYNPMQYNQTNAYQQPPMGYPQTNMPYQPNVAYPGQHYGGGYPGVQVQQPFQGQGQFNPYYAQPNQYGGNMGYGAVQGVPQQPAQIQANVNLNINLSGMSAKQQQQFGNFNSVNSASNVNWLSNKQKGLIDFSDFGSQIKNDQKQANKNEQINNNIKMDTWSW